MSIEVDVVLDAIAAFLSVIGLFVAISKGHKESSLIWNVVAAILWIRICQFFS